MDRFAQLVVAAARQAEARLGLDVSAEPDRIGASIATGIGGLERRSRTATSTLLERGPDRVKPFSIPTIIPNMGAGWVSMELGTRGPAHRRSAPPARRRTWRSATALRRDPARPGRRDVLRRRRGGGHARRRSPASTRCARSRAATTTPSGASRPVRRRARRLRDGRGRRGARARGAGARAGARREDLRRDPRLRRLVGRPPHHRARPDGREPGARDADGARRRRRRPGRGRLRQRARHLDAGRRRGRDARDQARARRGERATRRRSPRRSARPATASARPARSRRSSRILALSDGVLPPTINLRGPRSRTATSTTSRTSRARRDVEVALSNSFGFGGHNAALVFRRWDGLPRAGGTLGRHGAAGRRSTATGR